MKTIEYRYREDDRKEWGPGPWDDEPDKIQWQDEETGLPCLVVRGPLGAWCGYVGVTKEHPLFGLDYDHEKVDVYAHGHLTFSASCAPDDKEHGICHIVETGEDDNVWWFGFDCGHMGDLLPGIESNRRKVPELLATHEKWKALGKPDDVYRDVEYTRDETRNLARQLKELLGEQESESD